MADLIDRNSLNEAPDYDAGLLNDFGGGNVEWWQDYLRAEISRTNEFWRDAIATLPAQGVAQDAHEKAVMAEKMRMMDWCGKRVGVIQRAWRRAAEKALKGDLGDLRNRVDMMDAPPLDIVQSASLFPAEAGGVEANAAERAVYDRTGLPPVVVADRANTAPRDDLRLTLTALVDALVDRIAKAWPTVRDANGTGGELCAAIDEIDAALAAIREGRG